MRVKFWGVRGDIPTPLTSGQLQEKLFQAISNIEQLNPKDPAEVKAYIARLPASVRSVVGGNTTCVEIDTGAETIIIDCGSGMRQLGYHLMTREFGRGQGIAHIFLTHAHWDHLQGYPFFLPAFVPGNRLIFYAVNHNPQEYIEHQQVAPIYFSLPPNAMPAEKEYVQLREGETVQIGRVMINNLAMYHPGTAYAYRFDDGESIFVFASDGEYKSLSETSLKRYHTFFADADALVFDAQYTMREVFLSKSDWGHSSAMIGADIAQRARVKRLITFHHDPTHSDDQIYQIASAARDYAAVNSQADSPEIMVGYEGLELFLGEAPGLEIMEERQPFLWILALAGQLNAATAATAQAHLQTLLAAAQQANQAGLLVDLTLLSMIDPLGVKSVVDATRAYASLRVVVQAPAVHIRRMFDEMGASGVLQVVRSRQQALVAITGPAHLHLASKTIGGQYQVDHLLFIDDLGAVYSGTDTASAEAIVVRLIAGKAQNQARIQATEAHKAWQALAYAGLWAGKWTVEDPEWVALVYPKPQGKALREWLHHTPPWEEMWRTGEQLSRAVATLHKHHLVHGELHPENVFITDQNVVITHTPLFPPPPHYVANAYHAPEQLRGQPTTPRTDVYTLGILLYEIFLGAHPFSAETDDLRLALQLYSRPQNPQMRWPEIPANLEKFLLKMLALAPEERPASGEEVLATYLDLFPHNMP